MILVRLSSLFVFLVIATFTSLVVYWKFIDVHSPLQTRGAPVTRNPTLKAGDTLLIQRQVCFTRDAESRVARTFTNSMVYFLPVQDSYNLKGCYTRTYSAHIPEELPPGDYAYEVKLFFKNNPITTVVDGLQSVPFTVVK
jgi:hypothetical protein